MADQGEETGGGLPDRLKQRGQYKSSACSACSLGIGVVLTSQEAIAILHSAFPFLAAYPARRIEIFALVSAPTMRNFIGLGQQWLAREKWVIVRDDAWSALRSSPPIRIKVQIKDGPGDEAASKSPSLRTNDANAADIPGKKRYRLHMIIAVCFILAFVAGVSAIVYLCRRSESAMDRKSVAGH
jgi:hypothetical protein